MRRALRWFWRQCLKIALVAAALLGGALLLHVSSAFADQTPPAHVTRAASAPAAQQVVITPAQRAQATERARRGRLLYLGALLYQGILIFGFLALGGTRWLAKVTARWAAMHWICSLIVILAILGVASAILTFPLDYYSDFIFVHQYGLSNQTPPQWLRDYLLSDGLGVLFGVPLALLGYAILRRFPRTWWLWITAAMVPISIIGMLITPVFINPLFNKYTSLQDVQLRQEILAIAHRQGIHANDVYQVDASKQSNAVNAYVIGFGPTLRIVLYDTLLKDFTHDEIKFIMSHEMGHYVLGHIYQGILFAILGTLLGSYLFYQASRWVLARYGATLGVRALGDPLSYPLIIGLGMILSLIALPVGNAFSRNLEWQADRFAVTVYPHPDAGIDAFRRMAQINLSDEDPPRWAEVLFGTHPSIKERITALEKVKAGDPHAYPLFVEVKWPRK
jgi:Zn-dependent protease with chaperone function